MTTKVGRRLAELEDIIGRDLPTFVEVGKAIREIRDSRLYRETHDTFEEYCRERWGWSRAHAYRQMDAVWTAEVLSPIGDIANEAQARVVAPLLRADEREALQVWRKLKEEHGDRLTAATIGRVVRPRLERLKREEETAQRRASELRRSPAPLSGNDVRVEHADFRDLEIEPGCVDLVLTDPPYGDEYLPLWDDLAGFAARALRPGGVLACYAGQMYLPAVFEMLGKHLNYRWIVAACHRNGKPVVWGRRVTNGWKPILVFSKGEPVKHELLVDLLVCGDRGGKEHHPWGQAEGEAEKMIETYTKPGDLVLDPFSGGGTVPVVAARLGRRVVACDIDPEAYATTISRVRDAVPLLRETP